MPERDPSDERRHPGPSLGRRVVFRGLAIALAALVVFAAVEILLRSTRLGSGGYRSTKIPRRVHTGGMLNPDFRGRTPSLAKKPGVYRILVVGDSYAWGDGVDRDDVFAVRLERLIAPHVGWAELEVLNWSRPGWNVEQEKNSLLPQLDTLTPDLVLWALVLNDTEPSGRQALKALQADLERRQPGNPASRWLHSRSFAYRYVFEATENLRVRRALVRYYHGLWDESPALHIATRSLKKIRAELRRRKVPMAIIVFPIFDSQLDRRYPYRDLHARAVELGEELGIPTLDLLPAFEGIDARRLAVEPFTDPHPNELAHRIAARAIFDYLAAWRVIRPPKVVEASP